MKRKARYVVFPLIMIALLSIGVNSCKKEDNSDNNNNNNNNTVAVRDTTINGIEFKAIPAGTFIMGSPYDEPWRHQDETQHQVSLSAFSLCKYEITNAQYAAFLNAKSIGSDGKYAAGAFSAQPLIYESSDSCDWGLHYTNGQWIPVSGFENNPVINVTWYGATEFATYIGGKLPTEAQWEYAARGNTINEFNTGFCLSDAQANYNWTYPLTGCSNTNYISPGKTQAVGTYPGNAFGLHDMHGNVCEWCSDWYDCDYSTSAQTNPTGATTGSWRVLRGGSWNGYARHCRSALRHFYIPTHYGDYIGFRVVFVP